MSAERAARWVEKYRRETVLACIARNLDRSEQRMRERIAKLPDGEYVYEDYLEYFDAGVLVALKSTLDPEGPVDSGAFRAMTLRAPQASIVDVRADAPAGAHGDRRKRVVSVMLGAVERCEPRTDSGGEGLRRGGLGMHRAFRLEEGEAVYSVLGDRACIPPFGVGGAGSALPVCVAKVCADTVHEFDTPGKVTGHRIIADDVIVMESAGGGGCGDPLMRDPEGTWMLSTGWLRAPCDRCRGR